MQAKAQLKSYEGLDFQITLTASVEDWRAARKQLQNLKENHGIAWPLNRFADCIDGVLLDLDKTHYETLARDPSTT